MPILFICPHCSAQTNVDDRFAGQTGPCSHCGKSITIPMSPFATGPAAPGKRGGNALVLIAVIAGGGLFMLMILGVLIALLLPALQVARSTARKAQSINNLKQISLALLNYESTYGTLPPAYIADSEGRPMHSWRVLILPFLDQSSLYSRYDFNEPWDGPHNSLLHHQMPPVYADPASLADHTIYTSYAVVTGASTMFPGAEAVTFKDVLDGLSNTLTVVTTRDQGIIWCEPRDLDFSTMSFALNDPLEPSLGSDYPDSVPVALGDGSVRSLQDIDSEQLRSLLIRDDAQGSGVPAE